MLTPPIEPMLARPLGSSIPESPGDVQFEPKWDGFRALVFWDGVDVILQGRGRGSKDDAMVDLAYAFPEVVEAVRAQIPANRVLDGEIVIEHEGRLDFALLGQRLRPRSEAGSGNIDRLAADFPASLLLFDVLFDGADVRDLPLRERRTRLEGMAVGWPSPLHLTPATTDRSVAQSWFEEFESAGVDGLMVKGLDDPYLPGQRTQGKVKHQRSADVVVAGWRPYTKSGPDGQPVIGSLLLGLHDAAGVLQYVGGASAFPMATRAALRDIVDPFTLPPDATHPWRDGSAARTPGEANRWRKEQPWVALAPTLVAEVGYDQMLDGRFRHAATFMRWRPDRQAESCGFAQLDEPPASRIEGLLGG